MSSPWVWIHHAGLPGEDVIYLICATLASETQEQDSLSLTVLHWQAERSGQNSNLIVSLFSLKYSNVCPSPRAITSKLIPWHSVPPSSLVKSISYFPQESLSHFSKAANALLPPLSRTLSCPALSCPLANTPPHSSSLALMAKLCKVVPGPALVPWWCRLSCYKSSSPTRPRAL